MFELSTQKQELLKSNGHILVIGGPGSGKTTIALLKAVKIITEELKSEQRVLFLSFARSTIARVEEKAGSIISNEMRNNLVIETYHGFAWDILKSHGRLLNKNYPFKLLPPHEAAFRFADLSKEAKKIEKQRLFTEEGIVDFDLFANLSSELLERSNTLRNIICDAYPVIIVDEFQDTNLAEWNLIHILGQNSRIIALADAEQRIYEFRGADPARIGDFIKNFSPERFDFGKENNRSNGTDIVEFGNDLLGGSNKNKTYQDVKCFTYNIRSGDQTHIYLKYRVLEAVKRLVQATKPNAPNWTLAILVPSKSLMLEVSNYLTTEQSFPNGKKYPMINHEVALETAGPSLAANFIAGILERTENETEFLNNLIVNLCEHIRGRKGDEPPSQKQLQLSRALLNYVESGNIKGKVRKFVVSECRRIANESRNIDFSGDPVKDWMSVRSILDKSTCAEIKQVAIDAQYLRLLRKGSSLISSLDELWRSSGTYKNAKQLFKSAILQEHFSTSMAVRRGIHVMTMHKAKGKEFDEVIIYEGYFNGRIIPNKASQKEVDQARLKLRVAVTRAMKRVSILTPSDNICSFL